MHVLGIHAQIYANRHVREKELKAAELENRHLKSKQRLDHLTSLIQCPTTLQNTGVVGE